MSIYDQYRAKQAQHSWEDSAGKTAARIAEPLIESMGHGRNYYTRKQFNALAVFLLEREGAELAGKVGSFKMGAIEIIFSAELREDRKVSAEDLARITGSDVQNLRLWLRAAKLPHTYGNTSEKLYNIDCLREELGKR